MSWHEIIDVLACPACRNPLRLGADHNSLRCEACKRVYPVRDDIPILLVDEARIEEA
jgi:LSD1 subclass zinc finger protein